MTNLDNIKNIHCIGIGGVGLSAIAHVLISQGYKVSGSDMNSSEIVDRLKAAGAVVYSTHKESNVENIDLIVYSAAISNENPEIKRAKELNIPMVSRAEMLGYLMKQHKNSVAISGTHGKTTTTSMLSLILKNANLDPTILVGGNLSELNGNVRVGYSDYFITEACEYVDSFLSLKPKMEIILNIDSDHLDYFRDINHIVESFNKFTNLVPEDGIIFAYSENPFVNKVIKDKKNVITFGLNKACDYSAQNINFNNGMPSYELYHHSDSLGVINLNIPGEHNVLNSLAAIACAHTLGINIKVAQKTLAEFTGTQRRFDVHGVTDKEVTVIDDYAHHPTEIKASLKAAKTLNHNKLWCIFQSHTYTRTIALFDEFAESFENADNIIITEIYAAREINIHKISASSLAEKIKENYPDKHVIFIEKLEDVADYIKENASSNDIVMTMGAGDVFKICGMLLN